MDGVKTNGETQHQADGTHISPNQSMYGVPQAHQPRKMTGQKQLLT